MELSGIQNTINALYLNNFDSIDNVIRDRGAGLGLIGSTILKKLEGLTEIKYLWSYRVGCGNFYGNIDLDLSGCSSLEKIKGYANFANIGKLILPSSLTVYEPNNNKVNEIDFSRCVNLKQLSFPDCSFSILGDKIKTIESVKNLKNIESIYITETGDYANLDWLENFKNSKITSFTWTSDQQKRYTLDDISGLKYLKNLTSLKLSYINASSLDALKPVYDEENKLVSGCPNLSTIDINVSSIYSLESLSNITALTYIRVENSGVTGIGNFKKLVNLEVLNLQNNPLYDIETDENENVSEIFKDLNKKSLKYLRLYGTLLQNWEWTKECSFAAYSGW
jgi:hypothetical protein